MGYPTESIKNIALQLLFGLIMVILSKCCQIFIKTISITTSDITVVVFNKLKSASKIAVCDT